MLFRCFPRICLPIDGSLALAHLFVLKSNNRVIKSILELRILHKQASKEVTLIVKCSIIIVKLYIVSSQASWYFYIQIKEGYILKSVFFYRPAIPKNDETYETIFACKKIEFVFDTEQ